MEFVIVTHEKPNSRETKLKDMSILSIPEALLVYTGCKNKSDFAQSIVHISFAFDCIPNLTEHRYCSVNGTLVFRHSTCFRTAIMSIVSEKILFLVKCTASTRLLILGGKRMTGSVSFLEYWKRRSD